MKPDFRRYFSLESFPIKILDDDVDDAFYAPELNDFKFTTVMLCFMLRLFCMNFESCYNKPKVDEYKHSRQVFELQVCTIVHCCSHSSQTMWCVAATPEIKWMWCAKVCVVISGFLTTKCKSYWNGKRRCAAPCTQLLHNSARIVKIKKMSWDEIIWISSVWCNQIVADSHCCWNISFVCMFGLNNSALGFSTQNWLHHSLTTSSNHQF